eukprot:3553606-Pleurochrysis_carterae.AAC.1
MSSSVISIFSPRQLLVRSADQAFKLLLHAQMATVDACFQAVDGCFQPQSMHASWQSMDASSHSRCMLPGSRCILPGRRARAPTLVCPHENTQRRTHASMWSYERIARLGTHKPHASLAVSIMRAQASARAPS